MKIVNISASPKWNESQDEQNEILEAWYCLRRKISCRIHSLEERRRGCRCLLCKKWKKIIYMLFTHNIVFNYCIVRSECVLGCTVCFRFVSSIGGLSDTCVVHCWCIYTCHTCNFGQCYDQRHFSFFIFLSSKMATRLWYLCMREFLHFTLMCFKYFCSTTKNKQKIRKKKWLLPNISYL